MFVTFVAVVCLKCNLACFYFEGKFTLLTVVIAMETRNVSQRAELVIKSAIIKPTHLEGRYDWSIVLSFDITLVQLL